MQSRSVPLTRGLARSTAYNLGGTAWPLLLSVITVPYIVKGLGTDAFGVFTITSIVSGYLALLSSPIAAGNVRFIAELYGRQDWSGLRTTVYGGILANSIMALLAGLILFVAAEFLVQTVFKIPVEMHKDAVLAFRIGAVGFTCNGIAASLAGFPTAVRRFDLYSIATISTGTVSTLLIVFAVWAGGGIVGVVLAQALSSFLGLLVFSSVTAILLRRIPGHGGWGFNGTFLKQLLAFSGVLLVVQVISSISLQIDRTLIGIMFGSAAVTFYTIPTRITDRIPSIIGAFTSPLAPLSAESLGAGQAQELQRLYSFMVRLMLWLSALIACIVVSVAYDFLALWINFEIAEQSWLVLTLLSGAVIWRGASSVANQIALGFGRKGILFANALVLLLAQSIPVITMAYFWGINGAAGGMFIGLFLACLAYDTLVQRMVLRRRAWADILEPYWKVGLATITTIGTVILLPAVHTWTGLILKSALTGIVFITVGSIFKLLRMEDVQKIVSTLERSKSLSSLRKYLKARLPEQHVRSIQEAASYLQWFVSGRPGPSSERKKRRLVQQHVRECQLSIFVETGTYKGKMVDAVLGLCKEIYSVELSQPLFERAKKKFKRFSHVRIIHGDSAKVLPDILKLLVKPTLFWLDGHFSGGETARGEKETPIVEEMAHILSHPVHGHVVLIDDARLFDGHRDYPTMEQLKNQVRRTHPDANIEVRHDVICIRL